MLPKAFAILQPPAPYRWPCPAGHGLPAGLGGCARRLLWLALACTTSPALAENVDDDASPRRAWDASLGFIASYAPEYAGAERHGAGLMPGGAVRWGRVSIASSSAFAVRGTRAGAQGGLRVDLSRGRPWRASLGLRWDSGRSASDSAALQGIGNVRGTLLLRLNASQPLGPHWRLRGAVALDALGRGSGVLGDIGLSRDLPLGEASTLNLSGTLAWSGRRHMRSYFGVTPEQAQASAYAVYDPAPGLRQATLALGLRTPVDRRWTLFGSASVSQLLGPARDSPLTQRAGGWSAGLGTAYRF